MLDSPCEPLTQVGQREREVWNRQGMNIHCSSLKSRSSRSGAKPTNCSMCGDAVSGPSFSCAECGFYLHKQCAEAPSQIDHPFHRNHPLALLPSPTYRSKSYICSFCGEKGQIFVYHCSCNIDLHIKCALFTYRIAEKSFGELQGIAYKDPSSSTGIGMEDLGSAKCFGCWEPLLDSVYYSLDCGINLHKKCIELPHEINHPYHRKHPLILQFNGEILSCVICQDTDRLGFFYCCSPCGFVIHTPCMSPPSVIEVKGHPHPFTPFLREFPFTCDACGNERKCFPYMCSVCNLLVHKECISLPRIIKFMWHEHPISHAYFLQRQESEGWDCVIRRDEVDADYGSCSCLECHFIVHVNCLRKYKHLYHEIEPKEEDDELGDSDDISMDIDSMTVIETNEVGEATKIKHFGHEHNLMLDDKVIDDKYCDGCALSVSDPCYYCSECDFFLHKKCAEFPKKLHLRFHICQEPVILVSDGTIQCSICKYVCNGFAYQCDKCRHPLCLRCVVPDTLRYQGHKHPLSCEEYCIACGNKIRKAFKCKVCDVALEDGCLQLPQKAPHKCDEHLLTLAYQDDNNYSESYFRRDPSNWFYSCTICENSAHPKCVLGKYPFIKLGKIYKESDHPHPVTFVKKIHHYPECFKCGKPCRDLALECVNSDSECGYIVHWDCVAPSHLRE